MSQIFISCRPNDGAVLSWRIHFRLCMRFPGAVTMGLTPGADVRSDIEKTIAPGNVMLVIIGDRWLALEDIRSQLPLYRENDVVRLEIAAALQHGLTVIPVLIHDAFLPGATEVPSDIAPLCRRFAIKISEASFEENAQALIRAIEGSRGFATASAAESQSSLSLETPSDGKPVFVCYAREDKEFTLGLASALKKRGVQVWIDQWNIPAGADWDLFIDEGLSNCDRLLVVLSPASVSSSEVRSELRTALTRISQSSLFFINSARYRVGSC